MDNDRSRASDAIVRYFKEDKEMIKVMCKLMEDIRNEEKEKTAVRMLKYGKYNYKEIANISGLPDVTIKKLVQEKSNKK